MATKRTDTKPATRNTRPAPGAPKKGAAKPVVKAAPKKAKAVPVNTGPRHPHGRVVKAYGSKEALAKTLAATLARGDQDTDVLAATLKKASNAQLLRLANVTETVKKKWGSRDKLIAAITTAQKKGKDKDYLAKLESYTLTQLIQIAATAERAARA